MIKDCSFKGLLLSLLLLTSAGIFAQNHALEFNGINEYVQLGQTLAIGSASNTIELWVKIPNVGSGNLDSGERVGIILGNFNDTPNAGWEIHNQGQMRLWWNNGQIDVFGSTDLRDNQWHHLAFVRDKDNGKLVFYIDGKVELEKDGVGTDIAFATNHRIGADNRASGIPYFHGKMDELRIWDVARSQEDIRDHMYVGLDGDESGLVAYYNMNEGSGTTLNDQSGSDIHGTLVNMGDGNWTTHPFSGGVGDETNPYQIDNLEDLQYLSNNSFYWDKHFIQTSDIDASATVEWNDGAGFSPIGTKTYNPETVMYDADPFAGSFDGQGHTITGLFIDRGNTDYVGLFGLTKDSEIKNVGLVEVNITGRGRVGGLVGMNDYPGGAINNSYSTGSVAGLEVIGGLVGMNYGDINNSYSTSDVTGVSLWSGGLTGRNVQDGTITNSYAIGEVSGGERVGGLVGQNEAKIDNSYAAGAVSGNLLVGGLVGGANTGNINNSFWDNETSGQEDSDGGTGKTTAEMKDLTTFSDADWDIAYANGKSDPIWQILDPAQGSISYPFFFASHFGPIPGEEMIDYTLTLNANPEAGGTATDETGEAPYNIGDEVQVKAEASVGWEFVSWTGDIGGLANATAAETTLTMPAGNVALTANFDMIDYTLTLNANPEAGGTATDETGEAPYNIGDEVQVKAEASVGWEFVSWTGDIGGLADATAAETTLTMPAGNLALTANFEQKQYHPENFATALNGGTVEADKDVYNYGDVAMLTAVPDEGHEFIVWTGTFAEVGAVKANNSENNPIEIIVDDSTDIQAVFDAVPIPLSNWAIYFGLALAVLFASLRLRHRSGSSAT